MKQEDQPILSITLDAYKCLVSGNFTDAIPLYEQAIALQPENRANYAYLGLAMLLQEREAEAQMVWFSAVEDPDEFDDWVLELEKILTIEADRYASQEEFATAWLIRQHLAEISPQNISNYIESVRLGLKQPLIDPEEQNLTRLIDFLGNYEGELSESESLKLQSLIEQVLVSTPEKKIDGLLDPDQFKKLNKFQANQAVVNLLSAHLSLNIQLLQLYLGKLGNAKCKEYFPTILDKLSSAPPQVAYMYVKACLEVVPDSMTLLNNLAIVTQTLEFNAEGIELALQLAELSDRTDIKISAYYLAVRAMMNSGDRWYEAEAVYAKYDELIQVLMQQPETLQIQHARFIASTGSYSYISRDTPEVNQPFIKKLGTYYQSQMRQLVGSLTPSNRLGRLADQTKKLRIGYLSECLRRHSVGWISRWLLLNHDLEKFEIFAYSLTRTNDNLQIELQGAVTKFHDVTVTSSAPIVETREVASQIQNDGIDILIDLDSLTSVNVCAVMAMKPAPIQVTWLGFDASGIPAIDYFIADPYVLPDSAESYYSNKIWRLPNTYVAVNGFDVGTPNLRRAELNIPEDAVVYLSVQAPHKRHPDVLRDQMQILRQVPDSYFLMKSSGMTTNLEAFVTSIAIEQGISPERLRFLPTTPTEEIHRANMLIADVILDTYPYNGATTTLEALWMELPIVTRVGEQFIARNSYTMMLNAGLSEGIAWTDAEYIEWGVRLGKDPELRQQISWKLKKSKQTAPLWDAKLFTREMELAYTQMWANYVKSETQGLNINSAQLQLLAEAETQNSQGISFAQSNQLDQAIACFREAVNINPEYVDAYYNLGIALDQQEKSEEAIASFERAIQINPEYTNAYYNLGLILTRQDKYAEAEVQLNQALNLSPQDFDCHLAMGNVLLEQSKYSEAIESYKIAIRINPKSASAYSSMGVALSSQQKYTAAISCLRSAIDIDPNSAQAYCNLACALSKLDDRHIEAVQAFQEAISLEPDHNQAYLSLINLFEDGKNPLGKSYPLQRELADRCLKNCKPKDRVRALINSIDVYTRIGLGDQILALVDELELIIYEYPERLTKADIQQLYICYIFTLVSLRDDRELNSEVFKIIGDLYVDKVLATVSSDFAVFKSLDSPIQVAQSDPNRPLRIGFLSSYFRRHSVGWCSFDTIRELSSLTPHIYLYSTVEVAADERTQAFQECAEKWFWQVKEELSTDAHGEIDQDGSKKTTKNEFKLTDIAKEIASDQLDVLIDLDSVTVPSHMPIMYYQSAKVCVSWLGFDAPYISSDNYCLCDWHTHPSGVERYYPEKLIRLPDAHMAVSGFEVVTGITRADFGIGEDQIVYLYSVAGRKFNTETAEAHIQILKNVPNSVLMYKGGGDRESITAIYLRECEQQGIQSDRIKFMPTTKSEETHRAFYGLADVFLDAYPYNGGTHNLEALWFNLPVVTRRGDHSFARMGYSFLQALGINEGIAESWEEYISWAVQFGTDHDLRKSIKQKLIQSKDPDNLSPLWNPKKLAKDMYNLLQTLVLEHKNK